RSRHRDVTRAAPPALGRRMTRPGPVRDRPGGPPAAPGRRARPAEGSVRTRRGRSGLLLALGLGLGGRRALGARGALGGSLRGLLRLGLRGLLAAALLDELALPLGQRLGGGRLLVTAGGA